MKSKGFRPIDPTWTAGPERLHKLLARAGFGSRRACEEIITAGRVTVDGAEIRTVGGKANPAEHDIRVDGERISFPQRVVFLLYKPPGFICTNADEMGRKDKLAVDLIPASQTMRLYTVGRLDKDSEGLILVTNDGELTNRMTHPSFRVPKVYRVTVRGQLSPEARETLLGGVWLIGNTSKGKTKAKTKTKAPTKTAVKAKPEKAHVDQVRIKSSSRQSSIVEMVLTEGKNREIRRVFAKVKHPVSRLQRIAIGPLEMGSMKAGHFRRLSDAEVDALLEAAKQFREQIKQAAKSRKTRNRATDDTVTDSSDSPRPPRRPARPATDEAPAGADKIQKPSGGRRATTPTSRPATSTDRRADRGRAERKTGEKGHAKTAGKRSPGSASPGQKPRRERSTEPRRPDARRSRKSSDSEFIG